MLPVELNAHTLPAAIQRPTDATLPICIGIPESLLTARGVDVTPIKPMPSEFVGARA